MKKRLPHLLVSFLLLFLSSSFAQQTQQALQTEITSFSDLVLGGNMPTFSSTAEPPTTTSTPQPESVTGTYTDRSTFQTNCAGLPLETFNSIPVGPGQVRDCGFELSSTFPCGGTLLPGFVLTASAGKVVALGNGVIGNTTPVVGADLFSSFAILDFPNNDVYSVGIDVTRFGGPGNVDFRVYGAGGTLITTLNSGLMGSQFFYGIIADEVITKIEIQSPDAPTLFANLEFGTCVPPCATPVAACKAATVSLDASGNATLAVSDIDNGSTANCGLQSLSASHSTFNCNDLGTHTVTLSISDINGASDNCTASVTVQDNTPPTITLVGDNPMEICQYGTYNDPGATYDDNCAGSSGDGFQVTISNVFASQAGTYTVTYNYTDPSGNAAVEVVRTVIVHPTPEAFASQGCGNCGEIRLTLCQYEQAPDLDAFVMDNDNYEAGANLYWYADNNNSKGSPLPGAPTVNTNQVDTDWYWVEQHLGDCPGPAIRVRVKVKKQYAPEFNLPAIGCGAGAGQVDLAAWVSDSKNKTTLYTFYDVDPVAHPGATPIGSATATNGVVDFGQYVSVNVALGTQTYWVQNTVPNDCGGTASSTLVANSVNATLNFIPNITVNSGDPVNIAFSGTNATHIFWLDHVAFSNPPIGIMGSVGLGNLAFTAQNTGTTPLTATIRAIAYNGNCTGQFRDFTITVQPAAASRQGAGNSLLLAAARINAHDVMLEWDIRTEFELIRFEIEKKGADGEFKSIGYQNWNGNGSYQYTDESGMSNANQYRLKLIYTDGRIAWSDVVEVKMDFVDNKRFDLFPNPTSGQFQVKAMLPIETSYSWQLSDVMGKTLMQGEMKEQQTTIQIASLATGMYHLVMISPEGKRYLMKVVKQ